MRQNHVSLCGAGGEMIRRSGDVPSSQAPACRSPASSTVKESHGTVFSVAGGFALLVSGIGRTLWVVWIRTLFCISLHLFYHLTLFHHAAVLLTLGLAVELVGVVLAEAHFVGHTQAKDRVKGPVGWLASAGLGWQGQTANSCGGRTKECLFLRLHPGSSSHLSIIAGDISLFWVTEPALLLQAWSTINCHGSTDLMFSSCLPSLLYVCPAAFQIA